MRERVAALPHIHYFLVIIFISLNYYLRKMGIACREGIKLYGSLVRLDRLVVLNH